MIANLKINKMKNHDIISSTFLYALLTLGFIAFASIPAVALEKPAGKVT